VALRPRVLAAVAAVLPLALAAACSASTGAALLVAAPTGYAANSVRPRTWV
jgi:hypothetical protein